MRILVADDDPVYRALLEQMLAAWGHQVSLAADGQQAWDALKDGGHDLAIIDWMMPGVDGFDLSHRIRRNPATASLYVILLTGTGQKDQIIRVLVAGADDYIIKPFEPIDLQIRLRTAQRIIELQEQRVAAAGAAT